MKQPETDLSGKTAMITGASSGIGRVTALELARMGAHLVLVCRSRERGEETVREIREKTGNDQVDLMLADLSSQKAIRQVAAEFLARNLPLHVLLNNAGIVNLRRELTVDGIEATFAVNHLAYFLLTVLLLNRLKESVPARIVNVASDAHAWGTMKFDDLGGERNYGLRQSYGQSKLANILFTYELARKLDGTNVAANCLHPGAIGTGLGKNNGLLGRIIVPIVGLVLKTPEQGARTSVYLASSPDVEGVNGKYYVDCREVRSSAESYDQGAARNLWEVSAKMTGVGA